MLGQAGVVPHHRSRRAIALPEIGLVHGRYELEAAELIGLGGLGTHWHTGLALGRLRSINVMLVEVRVPGARSLPPIPLSHALFARRARWAAGAIELKRRETVASFDIRFLLRGDARGRSCATETWCSACWRGSEAFPGRAPPGVLAG